MPFRLQTNRSAFIIISAIVLVVIQVHIIYTTVRNSLLEQVNLKFDKSFSPRRKKRLFLA